MSVNPFGPWTPDLPDFRNPGVIDVRNVLPAATGYAPMPSFVAVTNALAERPRGAIRATDEDGNAFEYAADAGAIYENVDSSWTPRSKSGGYSTSTNERWEFVAWKNKVFATNFNDSPQQIDFGSNAFSDLTTDLRFHTFAVVNNFVVAGNTFDATDGLVPHRVRWCAFNDPTDWTVSPSTLSDFNDLNVGAVKRIIGGEFGLVFTDSVWRMTFVGEPLAFQFDQVLPEVELIAPGAVVRDGSMTYLLSTRGFLALQNGSPTPPIGANQVDNFVLKDIDVNHLSRVSAVVQPGSRRIMWAYPGADNNNGRPNRIVVYDPSLQKWSLIDQEVELLWTSGGTSTTLEALDDFATSIDDLEISLDSDFWKGKGNNLAIFDRNFRSGTASGPAREATIETKEFEINDARRSRLDAFHAVVEGGSVTAQVGTRNATSEQVNYSKVLPERRGRRFTIRTNARYHRFRFLLSGDWEQAIGVQFRPEDVRKAEVRV